jgi:hypothetical protein
LFNTAYQSSLRDTPFRVVYGRDPPSLCSYEPGDTRLPAIVKSMAERAEFLDDVRGRLERAQDTQKLFYDRNHRAVSYQVGDWALLCLRQRSASSLPQAADVKLKARFAVRTTSPSSSTTSLFASPCQSAPASTTLSM